jgi:DNA repair photolyase
VHTYAEAYRPDDPRWIVVREALQRVGRTARERGLPVVLFVHPVLVSLDRRYPFTSEHAQVLRAARQAGLQAFDLLEAFQGQRAEDLWVHRSDQHPNERGHALAAAYAAERLRAVLPPCERAGI